MTIPRIPSGFLPLAAAAGGTGTPGAQRTAIEGGPSRTALAYDRGMQTFNVSMLLSPLRYSVWTTFYHRIILKGAVTFTMELDSGYGCQDHDVTMIPGSYSFTRLEADTLVTFQVETENKSYEMTDADADALVELYEVYGDETDALLRRLARFALVDTLVLDF